VRLMVDGTPAEMKDVAQLCHRLRRVEAILQEDKGTLPLCSG